MEVKVFTTDSAEDAEAMRVDMENTGFLVLVNDMAEVISIRCESSSNGCTAAGMSSWVVIGKK